MQPKVSVIVPVYQVKDYISNCIESICRQTIQDIEIILIDDGSTDGSGDICELYMQKDKRISVIHSDNMGVSMARNIGIDLAKGYWICFVDGDDFVTESMLEELLDGVDEERDKLGITPDIIIGDYFIINRKRVKSEYFYNNDFVLNIDDREMLLKDAMLGKGRLHTNVGVPWGKLYKRDFLTDRELTFPVGLKRMQDTVFNLYAFNFAKNIRYIHAPVYYYNIRRDSAIHKYSPDFGYTLDQLVIEFDKFACDCNSAQFKYVIWAKRILLFMEYCKLKPCHRDNKNSVQERLSDIKFGGEKLNGIKIFNVWRYLTWKQRMIIIFVKLHAYKLLFILFRLNTEIEFPK